MKIPVGKIAAWIGRAILGALVTEAADRLARPKRIEPDSSSIRETE